MATALLCTHATSVPRLSAPCAPCGFSRSGRCSRRGLRGIGSVPCARRTRCCNPSPGARFSSGFFGLFCGFNLLFSMGTLFWGLLSESGWAPPNDPIVFLGVAPPKTGAPSFSPPGGFFSYVAVLSWSAANASASSASSAMGARVADASAQTGGNPVSPAPVTPSANNDRSCLNAGGLR